MPPLKNIFLSVLLLAGNIVSYSFRTFRTHNGHLNFLSTVASRVKGDSSSVTLFNVIIPPVDTTPPDFISAIGVADGGTTYEEKAVITTTPFGEPPLTATATLTFVEAKSWLFVTESLFEAPNDIFAEENCTLGTSGETAECIAVARVGEVGVGTIASTTTFIGDVIPLFTLAVTGPTPTSPGGPTLPTSPAGPPFPIPSNAARILGNSIFNLLSFFGAILFIVMLL